MEKTEKMGETGGGSRVYLRKKWISLVLVFGLLVSGFFSGMPVNAAVSEVVPTDRTGLLELLKEIHTGLEDTGGVAAVEHAANGIDAITKDQWKGIITQPLIDQFRSNANLTDDEVVTLISFLSSLFYETDMSALEDKIYGLETSEEGQILKKILGEAGTKAALSGFFNTVESNLKATINNNIVEDSTYLLEALLYGNMDQLEGLMEEYLELALTQSLEQDEVFNQLKTTYGVDAETIIGLKQRLEQYIETNGIDPDNNARIALTNAYLYTVSDIEGPTAIKVGETHNYQLRMFDRPFADLLEEMPDGFPVENYMNTLVKWKMHESDPIGHFTGSQLTADKAGEGTVIVEVPFGSRKMVLDTLSVTASAAPKTNEQKLKDGESVNGHVDLTQDGQTYGPANGTAIVKGNVTVKAEGAILRNVKIEGKLIINKNTNTGALLSDFTAKKVQVTAATEINGGSSHTVVMEDTTLASVEVNNPGVRLAVTGDTSITNVVVTAESTLDINSTGTLGTVAVNAPVTIQGENANIDNVAINSPVNVNVSGAASISNVAVNAETTLNINSTGTLGTVAVNAPVSIQGTNANITSVAINSPVPVNVSGAASISNLEVNAETTLNINSTGTLGTVAVNAPITLQGESANITNVQINSPVAVNITTPTAPPVTVTVSGVVLNSVVPITPDVAPGVEPPVVRIIPGIVSLTPVDGATGVSVNTAISVRFNKNIYPVTGVNLVNRVSITPQGGSALTGLFASTSGDTVTITGAALQKGKTYQVLIQANSLADQDGVNYTAPITWSFTTEAETSPVGSVGGGGPGGPVVNTASIIAAEGGTVTIRGAEIRIPASALDHNFKVTVTRITDTSTYTFESKAMLVSDVFEITKDKSGDFKKPVTITLPMDKSRVDVAKHNVGIYYYDEQTKKWIKLDNVQVDYTAGKVSGDIKHFTKFAVIAVEKALPVPVQVPSSKLNDIQGHWAEINIKQLVESGAIQGYPDGTFKPNHNITRAEFATVLVKAFGLKVENGKVFADTSNHWAKDFIATAFAHGIVNGLDAEHFAPDDLITREQMAVMIVKAKKLSSSSSQLTFIDQDSISGWAKDAVAAATSKGIIKGYPDQTFKAKGHATRAEAVTVIVNALK